MYWAALSTDIKKSSVNWSGLPQWMQNAVQYHNKIIEAVVKRHKEKDHNPHKISCDLLPNAPEGDAYTYVFKHTDMDQLREFVILLGTDLQYVLDALRNCNKGEGMNKYNAELERKLILKGDELTTQINKEYPDDNPKNEKIKTQFGKEEYFGGIFIRLGVAFSEEAPIPYTFKRYRGENDYNDNVSKSYRSGVICSAEKAEEKADYKPISRLVEETVEVSPVIKECYIENGERKFRNLFGEDGNKIQKKNIEDEQAMKKDKAPQPVTSQKSTRRQSISTMDPVSIETLTVGIPVNRQADSLSVAKKVLKDGLDNTKPLVPLNGFCVFVEYERALKDKRVMESPHLTRLIEQEYIDIHVKANQVVKTFIDRKPGVRGGLVKQKRDSTSMFVILQNTEKMKIGSLKEPSTELYENFSKLVSSLPIGSCVGFAYGKINEMTMERGEEGTFTDYFGESVNLAARMAMRDWSYSTKWGIVGENEHHNRVAFTSKKKEEKTKTNLIRTVATRLEVAKVPFTYDHVPLSALNAGGDDTIACISTRFVGWERLRVGDTVQYGNTKFKYKIKEDHGDRFKLDGEKALVPREELTKSYLKLKL